MMMPMTKIGKKVQSFVTISALALMTACAPTMPTTTTGPKVDTSKPVPVALLVPQSSDGTAQIAADLENAARLAAAQLDDLEIDLRVYDTAGDATVAASVAQQAVDDGAKIIIGPLYAEAANAAGTAVADDGINVLSFSNNTTIAGGNVFVLGKTFDNTAHRIVSFAAEQGKERAMVIHSDRIDGQMGLNAFQGAAADTSLRIVSAQSFELTQESVVNTVPLIRASAEIEDVDTLFLTSSSAGALPLLAQLLPEAGLDSANVQYAGLTRWDIPPQTLELSGLQGGWFAVPDLTRTENFSTQFQEQFGNRPHQLASLAFDGIAAIGALAQAGFDDILTREALTQPSGFQGVDGIFRLKDDGTNERGLAIATVQDKQVLIIDPAPRSFAISGF
ncbi:MAG: penicillin-binding protein activator [Rhodobacteraceae bacterium]|jgi:ABC-type branched-subunit amino acid transport system substrate-binding protein|nr:penicillin-binding protein activator [Paracoccaceae bacterium]